MSKQSVISILRNTFDWYLDQFDQESVQQKIHKMSEKSRADFDQKILKVEKAINQPDIEQNLRHQARTLQYLDQLYQFSQENLLIPANIKWPGPGKTGIQNLVKESKKFNNQSGGGRGEADSVTSFKEMIERMPNYAGVLVHEWQPKAIIDTQNRPGVFIIYKNPQQIGTRNFNIYYMGIGRSNRLYRLPILNAIKASAFSPEITLSLGTDVISPQNPNKKFGEKTTKMEFGNWDNAIKWLIDHGFIVFDIPSSQPPSPVLSRPPPPDPPHYGQLDMGPKKRGVVQVPHGVALPPPIATSSEEEEFEPIPPQRLARARGRGRGLGMSRMPPPISSLPSLDSLPQYGSIRNIPRSGRGVPALRATTQYGSMPRRGRGVPRGRGAPRGRGQYGQTPASSVFKK